MTTNNTIKDLLTNHAQGKSYIHAKAANMQKIYNKARGSIMDEISRHALAHSDPYTGKYLVKLTESLQKAYAGLEQALRSEMKEAVPYVAQSYYFQALQELDTPNAFDLLGDIDKKRVDYFVKDSFAHIAGRTTKMRDIEIKNLRDISQEVFRKTALTGATRAQVSRELLGQALSKPNFRFIDNAGHTWNNKNYFDMLGRTVLMNAGRSNYIDACVDKGNDVVRVTVSGRPCPACAVFENRLLSITGATSGLTTVDEARSMGLFHCNCTHSLTAVPASQLDKYSKEGVSKKGYKPPPLSIAKDKLAWKEYRKNSAVAKRKHGPMADVLGKENVNLEGIPSGWRSDIEDHMKELHSKYDSKLEKIGMGARRGTKGSVSGDGKKLNLNKEFFSNREVYNKRLKGEIKRFEKVRIDKENLGLYTSTHEFGHTVFNQNIGSVDQIKELKGIRKEYHKSLKGITTAKQSKEIYLSDYAEKNLSEFFTEGFTQYILSSKRTKVALEIGQFVNKHYRK